MNTTPRIEAALMELRAAQDAHAAILGAKFAAIGKRVGLDYAPELERDAGIVSAYERIERAEKELAKAERAARRAK